MSERAMLPQRRQAETFDMRHGNGRAIYQITLGYYPDGRVGEVFVSGAKAGSDTDAVARDGAVLLSIAMQYGIPIAVIRGAITRERDGRPSSIIGAVSDELL